MLLFDKIASAGQGERADAPRLIRVPTVERNKRPAHALPAKQLASYQCEIEMDSGRTVTVVASEVALTMQNGFGAFRLWPKTLSRCEQTGNGLKEHWQRGYSIQFPSATRLGHTSIFGVHGKW